MLTWSFFLAIGFAFLDWASTWKGWKIRLYIAKPAMMIFLIVWAWQVTGLQGGMLWFGLGLFFSLLGDIALLLNPRYFLIGLGAFLAAHVAYIVGFNRQLPPLNLWTLLIALLATGIALIVFRALRPRTILLPRGKRFTAAVLVYGSMLTLMLFSAWNTLLRPDWAFPSALLAGVGATLFFASDTMLGYDRFVKRFKHAQSYVHLAYHLGQVALVSAAMLHFLK